MKGRMKLKALALVMAGLSFMATGCGSAQTPDELSDEAASDGSSGGGSANSAASDIPAEIRDTFASVCNGRPTPATVNATIGGQQYNYTEVLGEKDVGGALDNASQLSAKNINGALYVEASGDSRVYFAIRKWTLAEDEQKAAEALDKIAITSETKDNSANVSVAYPEDTRLVRYETCMVIKAPAGFSAQLENENGPVDSRGLQADLGVILGNGNITIDHEGAGGTITANNDNGDIVVSADERTGVSLTNGNGNVEYRLVPNADAAFQKDSEITVENGSVVLEFAPQINLHLDVFVATGSISAPDNFPAREIIDTTGQKLVTDVEGGGATLKVRLETGTISVGYGTEEGNSSNEGGGSQSSGSESTSACTPAGICGVSTGTLCNSIMYGCRIDGCLNCATQTLDAGASISPL